MLKVSRQALHILSQSGLRKGMSVLDHGCGAGRLVNFLCAKGYQAFGYDPFSPAYSNPTILNRRYDLVLSLDVIEHTEDPEAWFPTVARLVAPGGLLCLGTPNGAGIDLRQPEKYSMAIHAPYHRHLLPPKQVVHLAEKNGFSPADLRLRHYMDTSWPTVNMAFFREYAYRMDNTLDSTMENPHVFVSLGLVFWGLFGRSLADKSQMTLIFRKNRDAG